MSKLFTGLLVQTVRRKFRRECLGFVIIWIRENRRSYYRLHFGKRYCVLTLVSGILRSAFGLRNIRSNDAPKARTSWALSEVDMAELDYRIETEQEVDGRWIAEVVDLPGVLAYGSSKQEAIANAEAIAFRVIADRIDKSKIATSRVSFGSA